MKNVLYILMLLSGILFFMYEDIPGQTTEPEAQIENATIRTKGNADMQHTLEILSSDLKSSHFLTPRRNIQSVSQRPDIRLQKTEEKAVHSFRLKGTDLLRKVSEEITRYQTLHFSTLLCRMKYHVYGLRKIII